MAGDSGSVGARHPGIAPGRPLAAGYGVLMRGIHHIGWSRIRWAFALGFGLYLADLLVSDGVPSDREQLSILVVTGLGITCLGRGWRRLLGIGLDWLPFTLVLMLYDRSRSVADTVGMPLHEADIAAAEKWLFGGHIPTVWLQQHIYDPAVVHWYDALATVVYSSHFIVTPVLAAVFWLRTRRMFLWFISRVIVLSFAGLTTYVLFPEAPPWLAARDGLIEPVLRVSARGWQYFDAGFAEQALASGQNGGSNPVAAMPSLHFAFAVLAALALATVTRSRWRYLLTLYPLAMAFTLVYTGEHYVIDIVAGAIYAYLVHWALNRFAARRAGRPAQPGQIAREAVIDSRGLPDELESVLVAADEISADCRSVGSAEPRR